MKEIPDILKTICAQKRREIAAVGKTETRRLKQKIKDTPPPAGFINTLVSHNTVSLIAEIKKASPSAGIIRSGFDPAAVARLYQSGGATCISVLTDEKFFMGSLQYLETVRSAVSLPILRKDFILEDIQIMQSRAYGADCVLLIVAALGDKKLKALLDCAGEWGIDTLVEVHTAAEMERAVSAGAVVLGINNRDLHSFKVNLATTEKLALQAPPDATLVSESGIDSRADIERLSRTGISAVLVGETLMRAADIEKATRNLCNVGLGA